MQMPVYARRNRDASRSAPPRRTIPATARAVAAAAFVLLTGCNAMSSPQEAGMELAKPIPTHAFGAQCFGGFGCRVRYDNKFIRDRADSEANPDIPEAGFEERLIAPYAGLEGFPSPAKVAWRSPDGDQLSAEVDIATLLKKWLAENDLPDESAALETNEPEMLLVIVDRTVSVMVRHSAGNANSESVAASRKKVVRLYSRTY